VGGRKASGVYYAVVHGKKSDGTIVRARAKFIVYANSASAPGALSRAKKTNIDWSARPVYIAYFIGAIVRAERSDLLRPSAVQSLCLSL